MSRKEALRAMLSGQQRMLPDGNPPHVRAGAVGAMGRSLGQIAGAAQQARALMAAGASVVELPAAKLVPSFVSDRLADGGEDYRRLMEAIRESGQRSPILVRPHPDGSDRYQIAFGHRRVRVLEELGRPVRAVVQELTDVELVVIQGQENSARTDLSYIERGFFALALKEAGYDRSTIMASLGMEKTQLSRLLALSQAIPRKVAEAIGPAPKAGRPRWIALSERLKPETLKLLDKLFTTSSFNEANSDDRFTQALAAISEPIAKVDRALTFEGKKFASVGRRRGHVTISTDDAFGSYLESRLAEIYRTYQAGDVSTALSHSKRE